MRAGTAVRDVTPPAGAAMSGFAARTARATGAHDPLLVHALVVEDTALVTVDVVGLHEDDCAEIGRRCRLPADRVVVHATHTHGGPAGMRGRLGGPVDETWLDALVATCADAVDAAHAAREPVEVRAGYGADPGVARNRRRAGGPVDGALPVLHLRRPDGSLLAGVVSYACHPVVLGADNTLLTADYPGVVRRVLAERLGGPVLFVTGCAGDANTGHSAAASISTAAADGRTFAAAERVGTRVAEAALTAGPQPGPGPGPVRAATRQVALDLDPPTAAEIAAGVTEWEAEAATAEPARAALLREWAAWGRAQPAGPPTWSGPVSVLRWGPALLVALPGEPFAAAAHEVRRHAPPGTTVLVAGYSGGCPGYLPPTEEYAHGGYEVDEAHRYYGMPGPFARGAAERVLDAARALLDADG
ncbi:neutral/alkaline non-lysosomal ceramidase N-terminal domain-containing protein [Pseudonocardia kunmingensis]|uniref:Neutral/alkaline ceramidase-like enzyme n=1 Tax=Pseudonocardia kunmingensis TaxID=630975 RepID=A0A543D0T4_9PSEU|nr:neutral/alkaline non-lysosomal ceramidase N-terminal domain-containing protein [Pseudonocardia kunmingensis]TQM02964.1 neutral/alkaline ceramidase-like enzyme [Pseudonocardia kunmingensis]